MSEPPKDNLPGPESHKNSQPPRESGITSKEFNAAGITGRKIFELSKDRQYKGYTLFTSPDKFSNEDMIALIPRRDGQSINEADIERARLASYSLALEGAIQISTATSRNSGRLRENPESLKELEFLLRQGQSLGDQLKDSTRQAFLDSVRKVTIRHPEIPLERVKLTDEQLMNFSDTQFRGARLKLIKSLEAVQAYLR